MPAQTVTSAVFDALKFDPDRVSVSLSERQGQTGVVAGGTRLPITMSRETLCSPSVIVLTVSRRLYGTATPGRVLASGERMAYTLLPGEHQGGVVDSLGGAPSFGCVQTETTARLGHTEIRRERTIGDVSRASRQSVTSTLARRTDWETRSIGEIRSAGFERQSRPVLLCGWSRFGSEDSNNVEIGSGSGGAEWAAKSCRSNPVCSSALDFSELRVVVAPPDE